MTPDSEPLKLQVLHSTYRNALTVHALIDAAITLIGFDQETDELAFDADSVTPEQRGELRRAYNAVGELLSVAALAASEGQP